MLFQTEGDYEAVGSLLRQQGVPTWVNCARRLWPCYQRIREAVVADGGAVEVQVTGSNWGLGCNAIHMLDLLAFLSGASEVALDCCHLDAEVIPSKRPGYSEFTGLITGVTPKGDTLGLLSRREGRLPLVVSVVTAQHRWWLHEDTAVVTLEPGKGGNGQLMPFRAPLQSALTGQLVAALLGEGTCLLPAFEESARLHLTLVRGLNRFLSQQAGQEVTVCPIT